eukprot:TRINITY_DN146_c0_g2_i1.p1 TRINITY_DN146_c0_g2~~TRINITY_DN146_c0_g2_i1.p1  ORF type:complete len:1102 (-),score=204.97 TRINITY_DN146_c0_g2_i1:97-3402(-)
MSAKSVKEAQGKAILARWLKDSQGKPFIDNHRVSISAETPKDAPLKALLQSGSADSTWLGTTKLVCKPDQLIKRRGKAGFLLLDGDVDAGDKFLSEWRNKEVTVDGITGVLEDFIVEPFIKHAQSDEYYVCINSVREGDAVLFYHEGGVDVGDVDAKAKKIMIPADGSLNAERVLSDLLVPEVPEERRALLADFVASLYSVYVKLHFTYLEINPLVVVGEKIHVLDLAARLDETAHFECSSLWGPLDFPSPFGRPLLPEEKFVQELDSKTGASLKLTILNPKGRIWLMVAGGGASVVYTDTLSDLGVSTELANYGEYSGDPTENLTYQYAKTILSLVTRDEEPHPEGKVLIIGGGIANFTDVAETFKGIVKAIRQFAAELKRHKVSIWVRRGGPNYKQGLQNMQDTVSSLGIPISVHGPETHMTAIVSMALGLSKPKEKESEKSGSDSAASQPAPIGAASTNSGPTERNEWALFTRNTTAIVYGMQLGAVQSMLDFDHLCGRQTPSVRAVVYPFAGAHYRKFFWGAKETMIPVVPDIAQALNKFKNDTHLDTLVSFASCRSAYESTKQALAQPRIKTIAIIAEGVPERRTRELITAAKNRPAEQGGPVAIIGPATVGGIKPGCFRVGNTGGMLDNVLASKLYRPGSVAYVSRSGGLSNELNNIISRTTNGVHEGVAIGGDRYPGTTFMDHLLRYQADPGVKLMVLLGEVGGVEEYHVCKAIKDKVITKPLVAWCTGTCASMFPTEVQFGHAGACAHSNLETARAKNAALAEAGVHVPTSFNELGELISKVYTKMVAEGTIVPEQERAAPNIPMDYAWAKKLGLVRKPAAFISTISDDRGEELMYAGMPISRVFEEDIGIGGVLSLLWFRRRLPNYASKFIEMVLMMTADHGPAVAGAHNTIVTARAGCDLVPALVSGLLTIGPRFGGAVDGAAKMFSSAMDAGLTPELFVDSMRKKNELIAGIGHKVKSLHNPDKRVSILKEYALAHFPKTDTLHYALSVEALTTKKKGNLILNVDGCIGCCFVDLLRHCDAFSPEEADDFLKNGFLNGLFVLGRSIGFIGHYLDQKRLQEGLYRHPTEDIHYVDPSQEQGSAGISVADNW